MWLSELTNPQQSPYRQDYLHGIADAMYVCLLSSLPTDELPDLENSTEAIESDRFESACGRVIMFLHASHRWNGFVGLPGNPRAAPSTMVARIVAVIQKYFLIVAFSLMTSVITSRILKTNLQSKVLYGQFSDFPAAWVACVPSPAYIDTYDYISRLQVHDILIVTRYSLMEHN